MDLMKTKIEHVTRYFDVSQTDIIIKVLLRNSNRNIILGLDIVSEL